MVSTLVGTAGQEIRDGSVRNPFVGAIASKVMLMQHWTAASTRTSSNLQSACFADRIDRVAQSCDLHLVVHSGAFSMLSSALSGPEVRGRTL